MNAIAFSSILLASQFQYQLDSLIKMNEELRSDAQRAELKNETYKSENLRLKSENKQFYGEQVIIGKDLEEQYHPMLSVDEANRQTALLRTELCRLKIANQMLNRQHSHSLETVRHLQKTNIQFQQSNNMQDQLVIIQSLESELERERKVRIEAESDLRDSKNQVKYILKVQRVLMKIEKNIIAKSKIKYPDYTLFYLTII